MSGNRQNNYGQKRPPNLEFENAFKTPPHKPYRLIPGISDKRLMIITLTVATIGFFTTCLQIRSKHKQDLADRRAKLLAEAAKKQ